MIGRWALLALSLATLAAPRNLASQTGRPFYNVDREVRIEATVREIVFEPRDKGTAPFLVLNVEEAATAQRFRIEVSPSWFFGPDVHAGEKVKITGSLAEGSPAAPTIIAREIQLRGETVRLRDKRGFPNWQGGPQRKRGIRRFAAP